MASSSRSWASASASTSTADGNNYCEYDVFLNHRGPDVKKTFVSHLYNRLTDHRLRVFLDREEIRKGEELTDEIDGAIRAASIHLAIFSPSYCQSHWCLNELLLMMEMKLQHIDFSGSRKLQMLPSSFWNLIKLQHINLSSCGKLQMLPSSIGNLIKLQHIDLSGCGKLQTLPSSFGKLIRLQHIDLSKCPEMWMPPNSFENFTQLKYLRLTGCKKLSISIETLEKITTFEDLSLSGGFSLSARENIEAVPPQLAYSRFLRRLCLDFEFKELPSAIGNLSNLKTLALKSSCLESLPPSLGDLRSLKELTLAYCSLKCVHDSIRMLTVQLEMLTIASIKDLEVVEIKECPSVEVTFKKAGGEVETTTNSRKLEALPATLRYLGIEDCDRLVKVKVGALPATLQEFRVLRCRELEEVQKMATTMLGWCDCPKMKFMT